MFAQMFPGMGWIPLIVLAIAFILGGVIVGGAILISRLLPLKTFRPEVASKVRWGVAATIAIPILVLFVRSHAPLEGPDPMRRIKIGMSVEQVSAILGKPHEQYKDAPEKGEETWIYYRDWAGMSYYLVRFDQDRRVYFHWDE
jgi:hypothetical protein